MDSNGNLKYYGQCLDDCKNENIIDVYGSRGKSHPFFYRPDKLCYEICPYKIVYTIDTNNKLNKYFSNQLRFISKLLL